MLNNNFPTKYKIVEIENSINNLPSPGLGQISQRSELPHASPLLQQQLGRVVFLDLGAWQIPLINLLKQLPVLTSVKKNCKFVSSELWIFSNSIFVLFLIYSNLWLGEQIKSQNISIKRNLMVEIKQCAVFGNFQFSLYF